LFGGDNGNQVKEDVVLSSCDLSSL
jgi:hypothetical protein